MVANRERNESTHDRASRRYRAILQLAALDKSEFDAVLFTILKTDAEELDVARVNCWQIAYDASAISCVAGYERGKPGSAGGQIITASEYPAYFRALADDPIILADDACVDRRTAEMAAGYLEPQGITSMMDVPVWVRGRLWGVICHEHVGPPRHWTDAERDFALSIGHIVAMSVEAGERAAAERTVRSSEFFIGILGHDLRNPLSVIKTSSEYLLGEPAEDARLSTVQRILRSTDQMTRMCEQLLDFTRIRIGGGLPVKRCDTDLDALIQRVVSEAGSSRPGCAIDFEVLGDTVGHWDPDRLWQLLSNLVSNALAHGTAGGRVWVRVDGRRPEIVMVQVGNKGAVPPELLPSIFDPFHPARAASVEEGAVSRSGGLGLGLFIARGIVTSHGGTIGLDVRDGETTVTVRLPRRDGWETHVPMVPQIASPPVDDRDGHR